MGRRKEELRGLGRVIKQTLPGDPIGDAIRFREAQNISAEERISAQLRVVGYTDEDVAEIKTIAQQGAKESLFHTPHTLFMALGEQCYQYTRASGKLWSFAKSNSQNDNMLEEERIYFANKIRNKK